MTWSNIIPQKPQQPVLKNSIHVLHRWLWKNKPKCPGRVSGIVERIASVWNRHHRPVTQIGQILVGLRLQTPCARWNRCNADGTHLPQRKPLLRLNFIRCPLEWHQCCSRLTGHVKIFFNFSSKEALAAAPAARRNSREESCGQHST